MRQVFKAGDAVQLLGTGNARLEGQLAEVLEVTDWGGHVQCAAAATGRYRAHWSEMVPYDPPPKPAAKAAKEQGFTGDVCGRCGSFKMRRNGACLLCADCGETSGCS